MPWTDTIVHAAQVLLGLIKASGQRLRQVTGLVASCHVLVPLVHVLSPSSVDCP